jgi:integrase
MLARLTDAKVRSAKPKEKAYKLYDGGSLFLLVKPNGAKLWRYKYKLRGIENLFAIGSYPETGLLQAREARAAARKLVDAGIHPAQKKKADKLVSAADAAETFEALAREWIAKKKSGWTEGYLRQVQAVLGNDVFPHIGGIPARVVSSAQLLSIIRRVEHRGAETLAILIRQWCSAIFRYANSTLRAEGDPAAALRGAIIRPPVRHKTPLAVSEISILLTRVEASQSTPQVKLALRLLLLTFVRPVELRKADWSEFDFEGLEWRIPAERMKMRRPHTVPLSIQAVESLKELYAWSVAGRPQLFPNTRDPKRYMSITTLNRCLERLGYGGVFSAHGFRTTASTLLNEMGYRPDVIELQLAHQERNKVRASYNQAQYMPERRKMMQDWADFLEAQSDSAGKVIPFRKAKEP